MCLESGSYLLNFACCTVCGKREPLKITEKSSQEDNDGEELVTYKRRCYIWLKGKHQAEIFAEILYLWTEMTLRGVERSIVFSYTCKKDEGGGCPSEIFKRNTKMYYDPVCLMIEK